MSVKKVIRVGFDLDGVILYNPARIVRPFVSLLKKRKIIQRKQLQFFVPESFWQKLFWRLFHKSSLFVAPGIDDIQQLVAEKKIEAYIITGRFAHLKKDTEGWFRKFSQKSIFSAYYMNEKDEQPHLFKERKIKELKLDYFVEDNWDIVHFLSQRQKKTSVVWITNFFDKKISFPQKFLSLKSFLLSPLLKKQKLLFVTDYFVPHWTGLSRSFFLLVQAFQKEKDCTVLTVQHDRKLPKTEKKEDHTIIRVPFLFSLSRAKIAPLFFRTFLQQASLTDEVIVNSPHTFILPTILLAKLLKKKVKVFHQGDLILPQGIGNKFIESLFNISTFLSFWLADRLATYTSDYAENSRLLRFFPQKTDAFVIPFPFEKETQKKLPQMTLLRKKYNSLFGFSGRFVEEKGFDILFRAIPFIMEKNPNIHFVFAGEKNMGYENFFEKNKKLYESVRKHVTFLGLLKGQQLEAFYSSLDALVMPSRSDCFGLVQAEAMKYQKPVVVSDIIGGRDIVKQTHFGEIFTKEDPEALTHSILKVVKNTKKYQKYFPLVKKYFSFEKNKQKAEEWIG